MNIRTLVAAAAFMLVPVAAPAMAPGIGAVVNYTQFRLAKDGRTLTLADMRGQVVVLTYWMRDCSACDNQLTILDRYYRQRHNVGLRVFAVPMEDLSDGQLNHEFRDRIIHPLSRLGRPFEMMGDLPTTYVIDRYGQVRYASSGLINTEGLNKILVPLLRQPQP